VLQRKLAGSNLFLEKWKSQSMILAEKAAEAEAKGAKLQVGSKKLQISNNILVKQLKGKDELLARAITKVDPS
jgi:hypothetical protein